MLISAEFPSKYLKASDLKGHEVKVVMSHVDREEIGQDKKLVLYFKGKEKGMVLNKTNANTIGDFYGDDSDDWQDQPLVLFAIRTEYQGKAVDGLRCRIPTARDNKPSAPVREDPITSGPQPRRAIGGVSDNIDQVSDRRGPPAKELNDDIPF